MQIDQPQLFTRKIAILFGVTLVLVPLIHYKLQIPTLAFVAALLALHLYIFFIYLSKVNWNKLRASRSGFITRIAGILLFTYMLTLLHYEGTTLLVLLSIAAAVTIHAMILLLLMVSKKPKTAIPELG